VCAGDLTVRCFSAFTAGLDAAGASEIQHMQKALQQMNLHFHHVVSDVTGLTGLRIIDAILTGQRNPEQLVNCVTSESTRARPDRCKLPWWAITVQNISSS
jgi:hypothetical protein